LLGDANCTTPLGMLLMNGTVRGLCSGMKPVVCERAEEWTTFGIDDDSEASWGGTAPGRSNFCN